MRSEGLLLELVIDELLLLQWPQIFAIDLLLRSIHTSSRLLGIQRLLLHLTSVAWSLVILQIDGVVAPEILACFHPLKHFMHRSEEMVTESPHANCTLVRSKRQISTIARELHS